jgi:hypothetical protein
MGLSLIVSMSSCGLTDDGISDPAYQTLRYEGGDFGGSKFKECVPSGEKLASNDSFYSYPTTQRQDKWDSANYQKGAKSADYPDMELVAKGGVTLDLTVTVPFTLNTSCEPITIDGKNYPGGAIQAFHEIFGKTRRGYFDPTNDGNTSYGAGWLWLMDTYISTCVKQQLTPKIRALEPERAWLNDSERVGLSEGLKDSVQACVNNAMETDVQFYTIGNATVDQITPDPEFTSLYRERQNAQVKAQTAQDNARAQVAEAKAKARVAREEAKVKRAEISGYGGFNNYKCIYLADQGLNCAQPQYVVGGTR